MMHPLRKRRLQIISFIIFGFACAVAFVLYALKQNINLYYTPSQISLGQAPINHAFRLGGVVQKNSVQRNQTSLAVTFIITDYKHHTSVNYTGVLPDLFHENKGVVVEGQLNQQGIFIATQVLAKHDENYMPPVVADSLKS